MSAFSALFGNAKKDDSVSLLLLQSAGPVSRPVRARTVLSVPDEPVKEEEDEGEEDEEDVDENEDDEDVDDEEAEEEAASKKSKKRSRSIDEHDSLERDHLAKLTGDNDDPEEKTTKKQRKETKSESEDGAEKSATKVTGAVNVDLKAEELEKAGRTVFVGNVTSKAITSKSKYNEFKKLFGDIGAVESIRFRSIAFDEALPRKVAFVKKALHDSRDTVNAYVVFKEKDASRKAPALLNASIFDGFHIRVDHIGHPSPRDNKRTIFVGNLDFLEQEETLWRYFNEKIDDDVEAVRIVRDTKTNLGKGFALVQFKDTLSVNKALLLNDKVMPAIEEGKKGRKLRILRAKAHAKPSILSPNHYDNQKKTRKPSKLLNDDQETKLGRAKRMLGKADRSTAGQMIVEGARATKGLKIAGIKGLKSAKGRAKKPRVTKRSTQFKKDRNEFKNLN